MDFDLAIPRVGQVVKIEGRTKDCEQFAIEAHVRYRFKTSYTQGMVLDVPKDTNQPIELEYEYEGKKWVIKRPRVSKFIGLEASVQIVG